jgi:hypothetical protein
MYYIFNMFFINGIFYFLFHILFSFWTIKSILINNIINWFIYQSLYNYNNFIDLYTFLFIEN